MQLFSFLYPFFSSLWTVLDFNLLVLSFNRILYIICFFHLNFNFTQFLFYLKFYSFRKIVKNIESQWQDRRKNDVFTLMVYSLAHMLHTLLLLWPRVGDARVSYSFRQTPSGLADSRARKWRPNDEFAQWILY